MAQSDNQASIRSEQRIGEAVETLVARLNQSVPGGMRRKKYLFQQTHTPTERFQIAEKADPGMQFPDGSNWLTHHGPSARQLQIMEQTSATMDELIQRIRQFIFDRVDTTRTAAQSSPTLNQDLVNQLVAAKVEEILSNRDKMAAIKTNAKTIEEVAAQEVEKLPPAVPQGHKNHIYRKAVENRRKNEQEFKIVQQRCDVMGIPHSKIERKGGGKVSKVWLRRFNVLWANFCANRPATAGTPVEQARQVVEQQEQTAQTETPQSS